MAVVCLPRRGAFCPFFIEDENLILEYSNKSGVFDFHSMRRRLEYDEFYSLSHKTVNARENFWNVYCCATNQMRDETAKDNRQTATGISYDLIRNNELAFSSTRNLQFPLDLSEKLPFDHKPTPVT